MTISQDVSTSTSTPVAIRIARVLFAALTVAALAWIIADGADDETFSLVNYFSYFTVLSNVLTVVVLGVGGLVDPQSKGWELFRGAVTLYMVITGIIFAALLANFDVGIAGQWTNDVVHRIMPIVILVDWIVVPARRRISEAQSLLWLVFPLAYGIYSLVRGPFVDWYPYPFLDPRSQGYVALVIGLVVLTGGFVLMALAVNAVGRLGARWRYGS